LEFTELVLRGWVIGQYMLVCTRGVRGQFTVHATLLRHFLRRRRLRRLLRGKVADGAIESVEVEELGVGQEGEVVGEGEVGVLGGQVLGGGDLVQVLEVGGYVGRPPGTAIIRHGVVAVDDGCDRSTICRAARNGVVVVVVRRRVLVVVEAIDGRCLCSQPYPLADRAFRRLVVNLCGAPLGNNLPDPFRTLTEGSPLL